MMKKLVLFFSLVFLPVFADEVYQEPVETHVEKIETAAQVVGVSLAGYGIYQIYQTWNNPESNKLFNDNVELLNILLNSSAKFNKASLYFVIELFVVICNNFNDIAIIK